MPVSIRISAVAGLAFILGSTAAQADWGCYDPEPGHPTAAERAAFIARLRPAAIAAETAMGVPASGLLAMAAQESGFGFTRTALNADNLFGWKYGQSARTAGLSSWRLECQPKSDPGKDYAVFSSFEDSLNFVARQLATASRYAPATAAARAARAAGESEDAVTERWLRAVQQAGYNPYESYTDGVMKTGRLAGVFDKPAPSPAASTQTTHAAPAEADVQKVLGWFKRDVHGRYMVAGAVCRPEDPKQWPGYERLLEGAIQSCRYTMTSCAGLKDDEKEDKLGKCERSRHVVGPKHATVVLLEPSFDRMARWISTACAETDGDRDRCLDVVYKTGVGAANWQIPVAGLVYEGMKDYVLVGYAFRDGLTVVADAACGWINGYPDGEAEPTPEQDAACRKPGVGPAGISAKARPMSTTRSEIVAYDPKYRERIPSYTEKFPIPEAAAAEVWRSFVRDALATAYTSDYNLLVSAKAVSLHNQGKF